MDTRAQELEIQKNHFYRDKYRMMMKWLVILIVICAALSVVLMWMVFDRKQPDYYAAMTTGEVVSMHSLSEPVITNDFIVQWSALTTRQIFNLDFSRYEQELDKVKNNFSQAGWVKLMSALNTSGLLKNLVDNRLIVSSVISKSPVILASMIVNGRFTWRVQMELLIKFTSASEVTHESLIVTMDIQRMPTLDVAQGIQITNFVAEPPA